MGTKTANGNGNHLLNSEYDIEAKRAEALKVLSKLLGSAKTVTRPTEEELNKIALKHTPKRSREIAKKYGLE